MKKLFFLFCLTISFKTFAQQVIPKPVLFKPFNGNFILNKKTTILIDSFTQLENEAKFLKNKIQQLYGIELPIQYSNGKTIDNSISLFLRGKQVEDHVLENFKYATNVFKVNVLIFGKEKKDIFYGIQTFLQRIENKNNHLVVKCGNVYDSARFAWRGMHLDVSRHFFPIPFIKKYLDVMAFYKMNVFHWHLTDDQGWRIEIKKYPLLTSIGSKRMETVVEKNFDPYKGDGVPYEGFYTQEEIKEIVQYAADRYITVVPEIEMPGHACAALAAYPQYSCKQIPISVFTKWGGSDDVFCVKDSTFQFIENILDEVLNLFPSKFIHIGGDEVAKTRWKNCVTCQKTMKENNLKDENELQSYFIKKIDHYVTSKGRNLIGWDEILEGGIAPNAAVMSWRGEKGGIEAANKKHQVVMTPGGYCYFDHYQGDRKTEPLAIGGYTSTEKIYSYNPIPKGISKENEKYILGAQGNVWTEYMKTSDQVEYMVLPRMLALSEVLWTPKNQKSYTNFYQRLPYHFQLLKQLNYNYCTKINEDSTFSNKIK